MAITTVGSQKTHAVTNGQLSVTLDGSPAVNAGDLIVWQQGGNTSFVNSVPKDFVIVGNKANSAAAQWAGIAVKVASGGEEGDTISGNTTGMAGFAVVRVFRPTSGWVLDPAIDANFRKDDSGTGTSFTLTAGAATTEGDALGLVVVRPTSGGTALTTNWDSAGAATPDYRTGTAAADYKIYSATGTPSVVVASAGTTNKPVAACWIQERPTNAGQFLPFLGV